MASDQIQVAHSTEGFDVFITDLHMPDAGDGFGNAMKALLHQRYSNLVGARKTRAATESTLASARRSAPAIAQRSWRTRRPSEEIERNHKRQRCDICGWRRCSR
jgi:hypothetical protein